MSGPVGSKGYRADMNVTPLIDILLVLLVIFMVITPLMMMQHSVEVPTKSEVDLPPDVTQDNIVLTYTKNDEIFINRKKINKSELMPQLTQIFQKRREKLIFLNFDPDANYGESIDIISKIHTSGVEKIAVITMKPGEKFKMPGQAAEASAGGL